MRELIIALFGEYTPLAVEQSVQVDGETIIQAIPVSGIAAVDWTWIAGVALFGIVLWSFMKLVGVLLK